MFHAKSCISYLPGKLIQRNYTREKTKSKYRVKSLMEIVISKFSLFFFFFFFLNSAACFHVKFKIGNTAKTSALYLAKCLNLTLLEVNFYLLQSSVHLVWTYKNKIVVLIFLQIFCSLSLIFDAVMKQWLQIGQKYWDIIKLWRLKNSGIEMALCNMSCADC